MRKKKQVRDLIRVLVSNCIGLFFGFVTNFLLPMKLSVEDFGYWQIYYFYSSFVGVCMFGFLDGIHLKYAGMNYEDLDEKSFRTYLRVVICLSVIAFFIMNILITIFITDSYRMFALVSISLNIIIFNINGFFIHINQISSRFKYYSTGIILDRFVFVVSIIFMFFLPYQSFKVYISFNLLARFIALIYNLKTSINLIIGENYRFKNYKSEIIDNFKAGVPLNLSLIISMLLFNYPRIMIDKYFGIKEFALYSFANSILSIAIQIIVAISTVLYPMLRKIDENRYELINDILYQSVLILGSVMLLGYFPIYKIISVYIPRYSPILRYLFLLFPLMIYQSKNNIIILTFYKTLRLEKTMFKNNIIGLAITVIIVYLSFLIFENILAIVATFAMCYIIWYHYTEWCLFKKSNWSYKNRNIDIIIIFGFILSTRISNLALACFIFITYLLLVAIFYRKIIKSWIDNILRLVNTI